MSSDWQVTYVVVYIVISHHMLQSFSRGKIWSFQWGQTGFWLQRAMRAYILLFYISLSSHPAPPRGDPCPSFTFDRFTNLVPSNAIVCVFECLAVRNTQPLELVMFPFQLILVCITDVNINTVEGNSSLSDLRFLSSGPISLIPSQFITTLNSAYTAYASRMT